MYDGICLKADEVGELLYCRQWELWKGNETILTIYLELLRRRSEWGGQMSTGRINGGRVADRYSPVCVVVVVVEIMVASQRRSSCCGWHRLPHVCRGVAAVAVLWLSVRTRGPPASARPVPQRPTRSSYHDRSAFSIDVVGHCVQLRCTTWRSAVVFYYDNANGRTQPCAAQIDVSPLIL